MQITIYPGLVYALVASFTLAEWSHAVGEEVRESGGITYYLHREVPLGSLQYPSQAMSPDGTIVLRGEEHNRAGRPISFRLYVVATNAPVGPVIAATDRTTALAVAPEGETIAICVYDVEDRGGQVLVYNGKTGKRVSAWSTGAIRSADFGRDSKTLTVVCGRTPKG